MSCIGRFPDYGVETLVFTGGEPLLVPYLNTILEYAKRVGLRTVLSTNGTLLPDRVHCFLPHLDWIGLPIDADCSSVNEGIRQGSVRHLAVVLELIAQIRSSYPSTMVKASTVACAMNKRNIVGIPQLFSTSTMPHLWKLSQVVYGGCGHDNRSLLELDSCEFLTLVEEAARAARRVCLPFKFSCRTDRNGKYLFFEPNGDAVVVFRGQELVIGSFLRDLDDVAAASSTFIDNNRFRDRTWISYHGRSEGA